MTQAIILNNAPTESLTLKTTLYDLVESIIEELNEDEAKLTVQVVLYMLKTTEAKFINDAQKPKNFKMKSGGKR